MWKQFQIFFPTPTQTFATFLYNCTWTIISNLSSWSFADLIVIYNIRQRQVDNRAIVKVLLVDEISFLTKQNWSINVILDMTAVTVKYLFGENLVKYILLKNLTFPSQSSNCFLLNDRYRSVLFVQYICPFKKNLTNPMNPPLPVGNTWENGNLFLKALVGKKWR